MLESGGVILALGGGREAIPRLGGSHVAWSALAGLCRQLASELGRSGIRVAWILSPGSPDPDNTEPSDPDSGNTLLGRRPSYQDVASNARNSGASLSWWANSVWWVRPRGSRHPDNTRLGRLL
jgi:3-oxoacyl-[acyl-carrier protein] reductase